MKATITRLIQRNEEVRGTEKCYEQHMEIYSKTNGTWKCTGNYIPNSNLVYDVVGTQGAIYLFSNDELFPTKYLLKAANMPFIDFT